MAPLTSILRAWRWYQWLLAALVFFYLLYIALSYLYLPGKLRHLVQTDVAQLIERDIQVQRIAFDPFGLALTVEQFDIADRPDLPLLAWQRLYVNLDLWGSLFGWQLQLSALTLESPRINIERRQDDFNFSSILQRLAQPEPTTPAPEDASGFAIRVDDIQLRDGQFRFDDRSGNKPATSAIDQINVGVQDLYLATGDEHLNPFSLRAQMPGGGTLALTGEYRADPLQVNSRVELKQLDLPTFADFVENVVPVRLQKGRLDLQAQVELQQQQALQVLVHQGAVTVRDLALDDEQPSPPLLRTQQIEIQDIGLDLLQRRVDVGAVVIEGIDTHQWLSNDGGLRVDRLLAEKTDAGSTPQADTDAAEAWAIALKTFRIGSSRVSFTDMSNGLDATQQLSDIQLTARDISLHEGAVVPLQLAANINGSGQFTLEGQLTPMPFALDVQYQLQQLPLLPFNPYIETHTHLQLQQGTLALTGRAQLQAGEPAPLQLALDLTLADVLAKDSRTGKKILQWQTLDVQKLQLDLAARQLVIEQVQWQKPDISAELGSDKQMNLATLLKPVASGTDAGTSSDTVAPGETEAAATAAAPFDVSIQRVSVADGITRFRDNSVTPSFKTALHSVAFQLDQLRSGGTQPARFTLESKIDKYAPFNVKGTLAPLQQQPGFAFSSQLRGLEMPNLSAYSGTYVGYQLQSGTLGLDLDYQLKQRQLKGRNNIVAKQLYLGEAVASEQAVDAPVALGLALLRDVSGVIDLDVEVKGDLDDPGFSVAGVVFKALMNVLVKAAASPFQLLASLVGGSEDLGQLAFAAGSGDLSADEQAQLNQLAQALQQRPQLAVDIRGNASAEADLAALQLQRVRDQIAAQRKLTPAELPLATLLDDEDNRDELDDLNDALQLPDADDREDALVNADPALKGQDLTAQVYQQMLQDVASRQTIDTQDLLTLADQRALAIKQYLVETAGLDHQRVLMAKTRKGDLKGRICELGLIPAQ